MTSAPPTITEAVNARLAALQAHDRAPIAAALAAGLAVAFLEEPTAAVAKELVATLDRLEAQLGAPAAGPSLQDQIRAQGPKGGRRGKA